MTVAAVGGDRHDLVLAELERLAGVADERGDVGAEEVLALAEADDERGVAAGADDDAGLVGVHGEQREGALEAAARPGASPRSGRRSASYARADAAGRRPRCRSRTGTRRPSASSSALSGVEVLDDAVVDQRELAVLAAAVRVGVGVGRAAVRGPAGVPDAGASSAGSGVGVERLGEVGQLAGPLARCATPVAVDQRDARPSRSRGTRAGPGPPARRRAAVPSTFGPT